MSEKLKKEDLKVGMYVTQEQLSSIYGVYIYLEKVNDKLMSGNILYIAEEPDTNIVRDIREKYGYMRVHYLPIEDYVGEEFTYGN